MLLLFKYKLAMKEYVGVKLDREIKEKFVFLAKQEKLTLTDAIEILIVEANVKDNQNLVSVDYERNNPETSDIKELLKNTAHINTDSNFRTSSRAPSISLPFLAVA